jgi:hypothetical protein
MTLWLRVGDQDDYHPFADLEEAADHLGRMTRGRLTRHNLLGVASTLHRGPHNYISAYFAEEAGHPTRGLTDGEIDQLNKLIRRQTA